MAKPSPAAPIEAFQGGEGGTRSITDNGTSISLDSLFSWVADGAPPIPTVDENPGQDEEKILKIANMSARSSTVSPTSSENRFVEEHGRTYHSYKDGKYFLPNDAVEQERLDLQHRIFVFTFGNKLAMAPLPENPGRVLDIATGTGIWAIEFAMKHPQSVVIGTDLSPIQPEYIPDNCSFKIEDAEDPWSWDKPFDHIHGRALLSCFSDHKAVIKQAFDNITPGGYLELQDAAFPFSFLGKSVKESYLHQWNDLASEALRTKTSLNWNNVQNYKRFMEEVGFVDVVDTTFFWPTNPWAKGTYMKVIGTMFLKDMSTGLEAISLRVFALLGWDVNKIKDFVEKVLEDFKNAKIHGYLQIRCIYGRKPLVDLASET